MKSAIIIPSRYGSSRFPGKPLAKIAGISLIERVWKIACAASNTGSVFIATDDDRIESHCKAFGAQVVRTRPNCTNGTERVYDAVNNLNQEFDCIVNLQGDTPLIPPWVVQDLLQFMGRTPKAELVTAAVPVTQQYQKATAEKLSRGEVGGTFVTTSTSMRALYFSRYPIPYLRSDSNHVASTALKHLGIHAFRSQTLAKYVSLSPTPLEQSEQLEQLRALENDLPIHVVKVDLRGRSLCSVDNPQDVKEVERIISLEGELLT